MSSAVDRFAEGLDLRPGRPRRDPQVARMLLIRLGVEQAEPGVQRDHIAKSLVEHSPSPRLQRSLSDAGFGDLLV